MFKKIRTPGPQSLNPVLKRAEEITFTEKLLKPIVRFIKTAIKILEESEFENITHKNFESWKIVITLIKFSVNEENFNKNLLNFECAGVNLEQF